MRWIGKRAIDVLMFPVAAILFGLVILYLRYETNAWKPPRRSLLDWLRDRFREHVRNRQHRNAGLEPKVMKSLRNTTRTHLRRKSA